MKMFKRLQAEAKLLVESVVQLVYFMRGSIQYDDIMFRTPGERQIMQDFIQSHIEMQKDNPNPVY